MPEQQRDFKTILENALRDIDAALESMPEESLILDEGEERLDIKGGKGGFLIITKPTGDVVAKAMDMLIAEGRLTTPIIEFILNKCLKEYRITAGGKTLDSKSVPKSDRVKVFIKKVPPILLSWVVIQILRHVPVPPTVRLAEEGEEEVAVEEESPSTVIPIE